MRAPQLQRRPSWPQLGRSVRGGRWGEGNRIHIHNQLGARASSFRAGQNACEAGGVLAPTFRACGSRWACRPTGGRKGQSSRQAARWGVRWCACGRCARGGAGAVACQMLRVLVWSVCAGSVQPGRVRWARPVQDPPRELIAAAGGLCGREGDPRRGPRRRAVGSRLSCVMILVTSFLAEFHVKANRNS